MAKRTTKGELVRAGKVIQPYRVGGQETVDGVRVWHVASLKPTTERGAWDLEADKLAWWDRATGFPCIIRRESYGHLGGYVGVPPGHPLHGFEFDALPRGLGIEVHGGICHAEACQRDEPESRSICHVERLEPIGGQDVFAGADGDAWWFGFQCDTILDYVPRRFETNSRGFVGHDKGQVYRDERYVYQQTIQLAAQLDAIGKDLPMPELKELPPRRALDEVARKGARR